MRRRRQSGILIAGMLLAIAAAAPAAAEPFVYQAVLEEGGVPVTGEVDLRFSLWTADTGGAQIGPEIIIEDLTVGAGMVTQTLDFGVPPDGDVRWLELAVRDAVSTGAFTALGERNPLNPTPLAVHAARAGNAVSATDALALEGFPGSHFLDWANLTGVPIDLADGDADELGGLICSDGEVAKQTAGVWGCAEDLGQVFSRTRVVGPVGDPAANGAALLAAMAAIPTPTAAHEAQLVKLEPGRYDLGTATLELQPWISLEGSGRSTTVIASTVCSTPGGPYDAVVENADDTEIRSLTIENFCSDALSAGVALLLDGQRCRAVDVHARCNSEPYAVVTIYGDGDHLELTDIDARAIAWVDAAGIMLTGSATLRGVAVDAQAVGDAHGAHLSAGDNVAISDSFFRVSGRDALSSSTALRVGSSATVTRSTLVAIGGPTSGYGTGLELDLDTCAAPPCQMSFDGLVISGNSRAIYGHGNPGQTTRIRMVNSQAQSSAVGLYFSDSASQPSIFEISRSRLHGGTNAVSTIASANSVRITHSQLSGGPVTGSASSVNCAGVWDESFVFSASACP